MHLQEVTTVHVYGKNLVDMCCHSVMIGILWNISRTSSICTRAWIWFSYTNEALQLPWYFSISRSWSPNNLRTLLSDSLPISQALWLHNKYVFLQISKCYLLGSRLGEVYRFL
jgi:hypothetical protein